MEPNPKPYEALLEELGFKPVEAEEVKRVEDSVKEHVIKPVAEDLGKSQEALEDARAWYLGSS
jgi:hypothetical protein